MSNDSSKQKVRPTLLNVQVVLQAEGQNVRLEFFFKHVAIETYYDIEKMLNERFKAECEARPKRSAIEEHLNG